MPHWLGGRVMTTEFDDCAGWTESVENVDEDGFWWIGSSGWDWWTGPLKTGFELILALFIGCKCWLGIAEMISSGANVNPVDGYDDCGFSGLKFVLNGEWSLKLSTTLFIFDAAGVWIGTWFEIGLVGGRPFDCDDTEFWPLKLLKTMPSLFAKPASFCG